MSRAGFGTRTLRTKIYELKKFNITKDEAESFAVPYDEFDIWNQNKDLTIQEPQIEKRIKYFHVIFIPVFPIETQWTIRNSKGLFKINQKCEDRVKSVYKKSYGPWYSFLAPIICLILIFSYFTVNYINRKISKRNYAERIIDDRQKLIKELDSTTTPFYLVLKTPSKYSNSFFRVDSIRKSQFHLSTLPHQIDDTIKSSTLDYVYHRLFNKYKLKSTHITLDSIHSLIPKTIEENNKYKSYKLRRIVSISELDTPNLEFQFFLSGIKIKNSGKPLTLIDFKNNSLEKGKWYLENNKFINTNESINATYSPSNKTTDESILNFIFSDDENFYEYEVKGTYKNTKSYTTFVDKSIKRIE